MSQRLGFIGLGNMGAPMAGRLLDAGYTLTVFDTRHDALRPFVEKGAQTATSPAALASAVDTVLVSLPTPDIVKRVALGPDGLSSGTSLKTFVDLSTTGPRTAEEISKELAAKGIAALDSPVSGGVGGAQKGTLAVMISGPRERFETLRPALEIIGKVFYLGDKPGLGQMMKLVNNLLSGAALAITSEAMLLGAKAGLDPDIMVEVINAGSGRNSASQDKFPKAILPRRFDAGFATRLMYKDLKLCLEEAEALGLSLWVASAVKQLWLTTYNEIGPDQDFTTIMQCVERAAHFEVRGRAAVTAPAPTPANSSRSSGTS